ncbi:AraC family transcriptional regulator [Halobacillus litoralis]|uniref:AraC family transcriptional regulator n=1 Tax=Halobacillus litoralis TaxID=45668 RepID=A0A845DTE4_9BACI|nr:MULTISPECIES: GyrI-like domain-containing protein [Halobacillus]MCA1020737.1 GyrI-like domain-containing protein [Halobacillus litoralis]MYL20428.1 AraC family transcriptional regulator [Halobacillus litoralis]MYL29522.1 AraC family transcriptional regulator [Halobacillus halophilus]MYL36738.1 AraC family transcriptional regulator [Halobacillus litoralis]
MSEQVTTAVEPKVVQKSHFKVVGVSCQTMMDERSIKVPRLMEQFHTMKLPKVKNRVNAPRSIGMFVDPPNWNESRDAFYWIAAVEVDSFEKIPQDMITKTVPAHTYAMIEYDPSLHDFDPYSYLHQWIVENGYQQVEGFGFEEYQPYTGQEGRYCLYLPIK